MAEAAAERGWPLFRYKGYRRKGVAIPERVEEYRAAGADLNVLPFTTVILPPEIIDAPKHRSVCFHPSLLPAFRGGSALAWQIIEGARESGISVFQPDEGVDTGPLYLQRGGVPISETDTMASLYFDKLYPMGVDAMVETVAAIDSGAARLTPQRETGASFQGLVDDSVAALDFAWDVETLDRRIRGCDPQPGAWATLRPRASTSGLPGSEDPGEGERIRLYGASIESRRTVPEPPGQILAIDASGLRLAARGGVLAIRKVRRASGKTPASESGLAVGDRLA